ncbi:MAG: PAS domain-containing protein [Polaromonas sp.]|uniref:PAS domain-containing protein n=1 Tax=Polaromonas sp. TaxID=1869339 RepID=UPI0027366332|nr:PAS domain-containing protein [Polaromonas sp.]MDP2817021.1 PAS domain-containing protein [Polaromonas sp.]
MRWPWQVEAASPPYLWPSGSPQPSIVRPIAWLAGGLVIVSACAVAIALFYLRGEALRSGEILTQSLIQVIEEQTSRTFQTVDQRLQLAVSQLQALQAEKRFDENSVRSMLREQLTVLPFVRAIWVLDAEGRILFDSDTGNIGISLADREYFQIYKQRPVTQFHLSAPVRSRSTGTWLISASRPLRTSGEAFSGVIVAAVEPPYFDKLWRSINLAKGGAIALFRKDGVLMMHSPMEDSAMGKAFPDLPLFSEFAKSPQGTFTATSAFDARLRMVAYRGLEPYPELIVVGGSPYENVLAPWKRFATLTWLIWFAAAMTVTLLSVLLLRYAQQRERTELRFRQLAQAMPQIMFITDASGFMVFINDQWSRVTGQPVEASLNGGWFRRIHPDDLAKTMEDFLGAIDTGQSMHNEHRLLCGDASYRWQLARILPNRDAAGYIVSWYGTSTDIDDLKQAEASLHAKTGLLRMAGQLSRLGGWALELPERRFLWSDEASFVLELSEGSAPTLESAIGLCAPQSQALATVATQACIEHGTPFDIEVEMLTGTGRSIWVRSMGQAVRDASGNIVRMQGALQDVTLRVQAEQEVKAQLHTLQRTAEAAQTITRHQTLEATMHEAAEQVRVILGAQQAVIGLSGKGNPGGNITALALSDSYASYQQLMDDPHANSIQTVVCDTNRPLRMTQTELMAHPDWRAFGRHIGAYPVSGWLTVPLTGRAGTNIGFLQMSDKQGGDFTQQDEYVATELAQLTAIAIENVNLLAEVRNLNSGLEEKITQRTLELSRQEALFRTLAEQAPQPIWTVDARGSATFLSRAWYEIAGGAPPDWHGYGWVDLVHPDDIAAMSQNWINSCKNLSPYTGIRRLRGHGGTYHTMSYRASPVFNEMGEVSFWVGIDVDVTETKAIEAALRLSNAELEAFSYSVSHDLRSPLTSVDGFSRLLSKELDAQQNGKVRHYLTRIQAGVEKMGQLIEGLLTLAHVARQELQLEPIDLSAVSTEILERLQSAEPERKLNFSVEPGLLVQGDSRLICSVMENLLGNAWKFSARRPFAEISVGRLRPGGAFYVRDNGAGFDMAYADKLFGTFQRLHEVADYAGTGIGLATVARVIGRHGGHIWAEAAPDLGATFFFTLPSAP